MIQRGNGSDTIGARHRGSPATNGTPSHDQRVNGSDTFGARHRGSAATNGIPKGF